jgi:copper chaperone CopZ
MQYDFQVENIRCGGCSNTITSKLKEVTGVIDVLVKVDEKQVTVTTEASVEDNIQHVLSEKLTKLGYPETGSTDSNRLMTKATSVVSCALGKVSGKR